MSHGLKPVSIYRQTIIPMSFNPEEARRLFFEQVSNCYWNPKLVIKTLPNGDRTVVTNDYITSEEPLVVLNPSSFFDKEKAIENTIYPLDDLSSSLVIPGYLYQFYVGLTDKCPVGYDNYFNALPTYQWYAENHEMIKVYISIDQGMRDELKQNIFLIRQLDEMVEWASKIPDHTVDTEAVIRAVTACASRSWSSVGLVPWIDFFNHAYNGSVLSNQGTTITATHKYEKGDEVNTSYGFKDSLQLLTIYGFVSEEKTVAITRPPISPFSVALDSELEGYKAFSEECPFLLNEELGNFDYVLSHLRLCALSKYDTFFIDDLNSQYRKFINAENEYSAIKIGLICIRETRKHLEEMLEKINKNCKELPPAFQNDFDEKFKILNKLHRLFHEHWYDMLK
jgi:hypothetical protein